MILKNHQVPKALLTKALLEDQIVKIILVESIEKCFQKWLSFKHEYKFKLRLCVERKINIKPELAKRLSLKLDNNN